MTEEYMGDTKTTKDVSKGTLRDAVQMVKTEIDAVKKRLEHYASAVDAGSIEVVGQTKAGYEAVVLADANHIAAILLRYDYHICYVLEMESPREMNNEIAQYVGLDEIDMVDIPLSSD